MISVLFYFNLQITDFFAGDFQGKQTTNFHIDYEVDTIEIGMIGDILLHQPLYNYASFLSSFEPVKAEMESLDILLANQESIAAGAEFGVSGYPNFSSPVHIIGDLKTVGVDILSIANNHTLDQKEAGVLATINQMVTYDMPYIGAYQSFEDKQSDRIFHVKDVSIGFLSYTYGTNGHETPAGKDYLVNRIDSDRMTLEIQALKQEVDFVIVSMHWGAEYELEPNDMQRKLAKTIADAGADVIFGHHPHVIQPYEMIKAKSGQQTHVFYSLGNFFSGQLFDNTSVGGIAKVEILKEIINGEQVISIGRPSFVSTGVVKGNPYTVNLLQNVEDQVGKTDEWVQQHVFGE